MLNELAKEINENAKAHGWWDEPRNLLEIVALCHSELSEAVEEYRDGRPMLWKKCVAEEMPCIGDKCGNYRGGECEIQSVREKPEGVAVEMADCLIRILDWFGHEGLDVDIIVRAKMEYNRTRPYKHGKVC